MTLFRFLIGAAVVMALAVVSSPALAQDDVIRTGGTDGALNAQTNQRMWEAVAYSTPLPAGAPNEDYLLVAWCDALVSGHVALGESLETNDPLDRELVQLGRVESGKFRSALAVAAPRQTPEILAMADEIATRFGAQWMAIMEQDAETRSQTFGLFFGLPGRCEHAARRIRENITTPPATLEEVGLGEAAQTTP